MAPERIARAIESAVNVSRPCDGLGVSAGSDELPDADALLSDSFGQRVPVLTADRVYTLPDAKSGCVVVVSRVQASPFDAFIRGDGETLTVLRAGEQGWAMVTRKGGRWRLGASHRTER